MKVYSYTKVIPPSEISINDLEKYANVGHSYGSAGRLLSTNSDRLRLHVRNKYPELAEKFKLNGEMRKKHKKL